MSRLEYIFTSFDILIPYKNIAAVLTVAIPTISLVNHKSVFCQKNILTAAVKAQKISLISE